MTKHCSGLLEEGGCKHGHAVTQGCYGLGYPNGEVIPVCVREDKVFDEDKKVIRVKEWNGEA